MTWGTFTLHAFLHVISCALFTIMKSINESCMTKNTNKKISEQDLQTDRMSLASKRSRKFIAVFVPSEACGSLYAEQGDL